MDKMSYANCHNRERDLAVYVDLKDGTVRVRLNHMKNGEIGRTDVSAANSAARPTTADEIERAVAQGSRDPEVIKRYRELVARKHVLS